MTKRQKIFCQNYLKGVPKDQAAVAAGYSEKNSLLAACRLLRLDEVKEYLHGNKAKGASLIAGNDEVLEYLTNVLRSSDDAVTVRDKMRAAELLGRNLSLFSEGANTDIPQVMFFGENNILD